ncbi:MAG TPA: hypothetical protein VGO00_26335 [Kofleriaceae bacterium]|nr:hypothetical protein [Kofleriaceae bacterium]
MFRLHHPDRVPQRGNSVILSIIVLAALATLSGLTVITTQGTMSQATNDRFHTIALRAAESGAATTMDFLRTSASWSTWLGTVPTFPANNALPDTPNNQFRHDQQAYYEVTVVNNHADPGGALVDTDNDVIIRSKGHGPNGTIAIIEWEVKMLAVGQPMTLVGWREVL